VPEEYFNWHEAVEFLHVLKGEVHIMRGDELIHAREGDTVTVDPFMLHAPLFPSADNELFYVKIMPELYAECGIPYEGIAHKPLIRDGEVSALFATLTALNEERDAPLFLPRFKGTLLLLMTHLLEHYGERKSAAPTLPKKQISLMAPAIEYIHAHFTEKPSVAAIAEAAHISESHLFHSFHDTTGMSVLQYINHLRFLYARTLLSTTERSVGEIAADCGFSSFSYFSKEYTRRMGESPSATRYRTQKDGK
jgi:AraC-like DNA-binding protein